MNKRDILGTGTRHIFEVQGINRELIEKTLEMRALAYVANANADLLTDTIFKVDSSKKALAVERLNLERKIQDRTRELETSVKKLQTVEEELRKTNDELGRRVNDRTAEVNKLYYAIEQSPSSVVITDTKGNIEYVNSKFTQLTGYTFEESIGQNTRILKSGKTADEEYKRLWKIITSGGEWRGEFCNRKKNGGFYLESTSISPVKNDKGIITNFISIKDDITERKKTEEQIKASLKEKEVLLNEVHHRVKNNLQIISSLLDLSSMKTQNPETIELFAESRNRVDSMAIIHSQLYESERFDKIDMEKHILELSGNLLNIYSKEKTITLDIKSAKVYLPVTQAVPCALVLNELISNSLKHAYRKEQKGLISITMQQSNDGTIIMKVKDNGVSIPDEIDIDSAKSLGLKLVKNIVCKQLNGKMEIIRNKGTEFIIEFKSPMERKHEQINDSG